jgi:hypothetical protein
MRRNLNEKKNSDERPWEFRRADHATPLYQQKLTLKFAEQ